MYLRITSWSIGNIAGYSWKLATKNVFQRLNAMNLTNIFKYSEFFPHKCSLYQPANFEIVSRWTDKNLTLNKMIEVSQSGWSVWIICHFYVQYTSISWWMCRLRLKSKHGLWSKPVWHTVSGLQWMMHESGLDQLICDKSVVWNS